ncbi:Pr6Pr family membrane protein [Thermoleophilia bacterium SCSIO 60948]|nr:Pr6Pr family membrane protein [Thermoleophilia bacterium SCSIO 60948]
MIVWRLLVAASGLLGVTLAVLEFDGGLGALSQQASLAAGLLYALLAALAVVRPVTDLPWARGAMASILALVAVTYAFLLSPDYGPLYSLLEHVVTPILVIADFLLLAHATQTSWWWPISWLVAPLAYLAYYLTQGLDLYPFLDPQDPGFAGLIAGFLVGLLAIGYAMLAVVRARSAR